jgi:hypothetical protein
VLFVECVACIMAAQKSGYTDCACVHKSDLGTGILSEKHPFFSMLAILASIAYDVTVGELLLGQKFRLQYDLTRRA